MFEPGAVLKNTFEIIEKYGQGGMGITYRAKNLLNGDKVIVKSLLLHRLGEWKSLELFKREAQVLKNIDHPFIPDYVDFFEHGKDENLSFILVQEFVQGQNLLLRAKEGWHATEDEMKQIAIKLFRIIHYIHSLKPPIIHRDINPKNIIMKENGDIYLVDFGSVQDVMKNLEYGNSTFVGTPGYTPIEQFQGQATTKSDLFAAAATIVYLLTHKELGDFAGEGLKPDVSKFTQSPALRGILDNYLEPDQTKRTIPLEDAIQILEGKMNPPGKAKESRGILGNFIDEMKQLQGMYHEADVNTTGNTDPGPLPPGSPLQCTHTGEEIDIVIPPGSGSGGGGIGVFAVFWNVFILIFTTIFLGAGIAAGGEIPVFVYLFFIPFWAVGIGMGYVACYQQFGTTRVYLNKNGIGYIEKTLFGNTKKKSFDVQTVQHCIMQEAYRSNNVPVYKCVIVTPTKKYSFGNKLSNREKQWVCHLINYRVNQFR